MWFRVEGLGFTILMHTIVLRLVIFTTSLDVLKHAMILFLATSDDNVGVDDEDDDDDDDDDDDS